MTEFNYHFNLQLPSNPFTFSFLDERTCLYYYTKTFNCKPSSKSAFTKGSKAYIASLCNQLVDNIAALCNADKWNRILFISSKMIRNYFVIWIRFHGI